MVMQARCGPLLFRQPGGAALHQAGVSLPTLLTIWSAYGGERMLMFPSLWFPQQHWRQAVHERAIVKTRAILLSLAGPESQAHGTRCATGGTDRYPHCWFSTITFMACPERISSTP